MSADLLHRAAAALRQHAEAATPGPWGVERDEEGLHTYVRTTAPTKWEYQREVVDDHIIDEKWPNYDFIVLMHPPVALALAAVLDNVAAAIGSTVDDRTAADIFGSELALARAILRETDHG